MEITGICPPRVDSSALASGPLGPHADIKPNLSIVPGGSQEYARQHNEMSTDLARQMRSTHNPIRIIFLW